MAGRDKKKNFASFVRRRNAFESRSNRDRGGDITCPRPRAGSGNCGGVVGPQDFRSADCAARTRVKVQTKFVFFAGLTGYFFFVPAGLPQLAAAFSQLVAADSAVVRLTSKLSDVAHQQEGPDAGGNNGGINWGQRRNSRARCAVSYNRSLLRLPTGRSAKEKRQTKKERAQGVGNRRKRIL